MTHATKALLLAFTTVATVMIAGCTDTSGEPDEVGAPQAQFDQTTGGIVGVVLDENELPLAGAEVGIMDGEEIVDAATTTEAGAFVFSRVQPGEHLLMASALGHIPASITVTVTAGALTENAQIILARGAIIEPYYLTEFHRRTISAFDVKPLPMCVYFSDYVPQAGSLKTCAGGTLPGGCSDPTPCTWDWNETLTNNPDWTTQIYEGTWTGSSAATGRAFSIDLAAPGYRTGSYNFQDKEVFYDEGNDPPLVIRVDNPDTLVEREIPEDQWCCNWRTRLFGASCTLGNCYDGFGPDYGLLIDQSIDLYFTHAFHEPLPPDFSALPDDA